MKEWQTHLVSPEEHGAEETSVYGGLVHHHTVFLVVAGVAGDSHYGIVTGRKLPVKCRDTIK